MWKNALQYLFKLYFQEPATGQGISSTVQKNRYGMSGTKEEVPFTACLISSINDSLGQSSRARGFKGTNLSSLTLKISRGRRGLVWIKVDWGETSFILGMICNINILVYLSWKASPLSREEFNPGIIYAVKGSYLFNMPNQCSSACRSFRCRTQNSSPKTFRVYLQGRVTLGSQALYIPNTI